MHRWHALRATDPVIEVRSLDLASPVSYAVVVVLALIDGVIPLVPARTAVIGLGVLAGSGRAAAYLLLAVATAAAFVSDNVSYWLGAHYWPRIQPVLFRGARTRRAWGWVERQLRLHGATLVVLARVLPGGPTPITLSAGSVGLRRRTFRLAALAGAVLWSLYAFGVGLAADGGDHVAGDEAHDPGIGRLGGGGGAEGKGPAGVDHPGADGLARGALDRLRLAGEGGLVEDRSPGLDPTVDRYHVAGFDHEQRPHGDPVDGEVDDGAVLEGVGDGGGACRQGRQLVARPPRRPRLEGPGRWRA